MSSPAWELILMPVPDDQAHLCISVHMHRSHPGNGSYLFCEKTCAEWQVLLNAIPQSCEGLQLKLDWLQT